MAEIPAQNIGPVGPQNQGILDQTLGEILNTNPQAQTIIMQTMHLTPEKFQQMVQNAENNPMMNMKISELLKNGMVQQAIAQQGQINPEQINQMAQTAEQGNQTVAVTQKTSILDKVKSWFVK